MSTQISIDNQSGFAYDFARHRRVGRSSFLTGYRHLFGFLLILALVLSQGILCPSAQADTFPGKGSHQAWDTAGKLFNEANHLCDQNKYEQAMSKYKSAIAVYPYDPSYFQGLGFAYEKSQKLDQAEKAYRESLQLNGKQWEVWNGLKNVYYKQGRYLECKQACLKVLECNPPTERRARVEAALRELEGKLGARKSTVGAQP